MHGSSYNDSIENLQSTESSGSVRLRYHRKIRRFWFILLCQTITNLSIVGLSLVYFAREWRYNSKMPIEHPKSPFPQLLYCKCYFRLVKDNVDDLFRQLRYNTSSNTRPGYFMKVSVRTKAYISYLPHPKLMRLGRISMTVNHFNFCAPIYQFVYLPPVGISHITKEEASQLVNQTYRFPGHKDHYCITLDVFHQLHCLVSSLRPS